MEKAGARGFTLIEMIVVIAIILILAGLLFPAVSGAIEKGRVTQDLNNLRQIGLATQMYLNDNDGTYPLPSAWPAALNPKYISTWKTFQSPFDKSTTGGRVLGEDSSGKAAVSYGMNSKAQSSTSGTALLSDKVTVPTVFILFAAAPDQSNPLSFSGTATSSPQVTQPSGAGTAYGTHNNRNRIDACMADLHVENMSWTTFAAANSTTDKCAPARWDPSQSCQ